MPRLITRQEALDRIVAEGGRPDCLMCAIRDRAVGPVYAVYEDEHMLVSLPRYVRRWGHMMVMPKIHVVSYSEVDPAAVSWPSHSSPTSEDEQADARIAAANDHRLRRVMYEG